LNLCKVEKKNFDLLPNFWYIKDSNITSGAQRKIFEKGTIFFGHPVYFVNTAGMNKLKTVNPKLDQIAVLCFEIEREFIQ